MEWSAQQRAVFDWIEIGAGSAVVEAVAGAGKTTTLVEAVRRMRGSVFLGAYNTKMAAELKTRVADVPNAMAGTFHSAGFSALRRAAGKRRLEVDDKKVRKIVDVQIVGEELREWKPAICALVSLAQQSGFYCRGLIEAPTRYDWMEQISRHDVMDRLPEDANPNRLMDMAAEALHTSNEDYDVVSFDDMCYLPLLRDLRMFQNDWVLVDECFLSDTPVLTGLNGEWQTIGDIVNNRYVGPVLSWSAERGTHVSLVTGHKRVRRAKRMVQIKYVQKHPTYELLTRKVRLGQPIVVCTEDHQIKTESGWTSAGQLTLGQTVYMETLQGRVRDYQQIHMITARGKSALRAAQSGNTRGGGSAGDTRAAFNAVKGGNGRTSPTEQLFADKMREAGVNVTPNVVIRTRMGRGSIYPNHYKVDFVVDDSMTLVEIDGASHSSIAARERDAKKDEFLSSLGYNIVRIKNNEVRRSTPDQLAALVQPRCFVEAEVTSVEEYETEEEYVYDIEVADTHCYFAHGLLVHNCQDTNAVRRALAARMLRRGGRLVAVGDPHQAIFGFTGADGDSLELIKRQFSARTLELSVTYRCPKLIVREAREYVDHITAAPTAPDGEVGEIEYDELAPLAAPGDAVLCRYNAPLVALCFKLIRAGKPAKIEGRAIGEGLAALAGRWKVKTLDALEGRLERYFTRERERAKAKEDESKLDRLEDTEETMRVLVLRAREQGVTTVAALQQMVRDMFDDVGSSKRLIVLSSVHRSKGLEWPRVFVLGRRELMPSRRAVQSWQVQQETNLIYVALTRAQQTLIDVSMPPRAEGEQR